jgi:hypothetical protein
MASAAPPPFKISAKSAAEEGEKIHKIRITLSSRNVVNLEKGEQSRGRPLLYLGL